MQIQPEDWTSLSGWWKTLGFVLFAAFGGMMGHMMRSIQERHRISLLRTLLEGCAAGFVGMLVVLTCRAMNLSEEWTGVIVGVSGWLGANATIRILEGVVRRRLGIGVAPYEEPRTRKEDHDKPAQ